MLSVECAAFRLTEIMAKRAAVSGQNKWPVCPSHVWIYVDKVMDDIIFYGKKCQFSSDMKC